MIDLEVLGVYGLGSRSSDRRQPPIAPRRIDGG
ncbi:hypothetical protein ISN45_At01g032920 [Arabidopsis thaliana x Arabidopsis arenosa]|uniref:Uncharacterized protein n=2 Tax=Arabidopsis TaxID=3701 RepID=Q0WN65_ARATH|nr:uncharacterized protein AT1G33102 [Arabidopsis thaliana]AEE31565.1 hypothetical protein AT1G33102 [Arabidopsis thaliana]KAG7648327.1 hypothetical protein ISN45_At01g032920 [Arabidopsis thaliana x Arabidopsis arenosa]BAF01435.1 hypothetical protein [Arabidopsis thaliana]|eukprot:NP_001117403.1 hypothetical protein AT1G33102 [Arabidopsis thaliana]